MENDAAVGTGNKIGAVKLGTFKHTPMMVRSRLTFKLRFEEEEGIYFIVMESRDYESAIRLKNIESFREVPN